MDVERRRRGVRALGQDQQRAEHQYGRGAAPARPSRGTIALAMPLVNGRQTKVGRRALLKA
jgi:hypothetical protein